MDLQRSLFSSSALRGIAMDSFLTGRSPLLPFCYLLFSGLFGDEAVKQAAVISGGPSA